MLFAHVVEDSAQSRQLSRSGIRIDRRMGADNGWRADGRTVESQASAAAPAGGTATRAAAEHPCADCRRGDKPPGKYTDAARDGAEWELVRASAPTLDRGHASRR